MKRSQTKLHSVNVFGANSIKDIKGKEVINKLIEEEEVNSASTSEKITIKTTIYFVIYLVSLIKTLQIINAVPPSYSFNTAIIQSLENLYESTDGYIPINGSRASFDGIKKKEDIFNWMKQTLIPGMYDANRGFQSFDYPSTVDNVLGMISLTNIKIVQRRAAVVVSPSNDSLYKSWWDPEGGISKASYGKPNFNFSEEDYGFPIEIPVLFQSKSMTLNEFTEFWTKSGYIDSQTKALDVTVAIFNKINLFMISVNATFQFSPSGYVQDKIFSTYSYPVAPFNDKSLIMWNVLYVIFASYFAIQEALKVSVHIKNALMKGSIVPTKVGIDAGLKAVGAIREKLKNVLIGLLHHIKDPWTFLNLLTIILSLFSMITWIQIFTNSKLEDDISSLGMVDGIIQNITPEKIATVRTFTNVVGEKVKKFIILIQVLSINSILLTIKSVKFIDEFLPAAKEMSTVIVKTLNKIIPFLVLLTCLLFAFAIGVNSFLGDLFFDLSTFLKCVFYFYTNLNGNFDYAEGIYLAEPAFAFFFHVIFIIFINFIIGVMFLIYASHVYEDYFSGKEVKVDNFEHLGKFEFRPHILWYLKNKFYFNLKMMYLKKFNKKKYTDVGQEDLIREKNERREMAPYTKFNFDLSIQETQEKKNKKHKVYINERTRHKISVIKQQETFRMIWSLIFAIILAIFFLVVSLSHQKTVDGRGMINSVENFFETKNVQIINPANGKKVTASYNIPLEALQNVDQLAGWLSLFSYFGSYGEYKLSSGKTYKGYFFGGVNYLLTNQYRITVRRSNIIKKDSGAFNALGQLSFSNSFPINAIGPRPEENTTRIFGNYSKTWYNYTNEDTYLHAGGYHLYADVDKIRQGLYTLVQDTVIDTSIVIFIIDFPIYQITSNNAMYVYIAFTFDDSFNMIFQRSISMIGLDYYNTSDQKFVAFLEICILIAFVIMTYKLAHKIYLNFVYYNHWYSIHVAYFPAVMVRTREKKEPEIIRKWKFIIDFKEIMDMVFLILLFMCIIVWITYLTKRQVILDRIDAFINNSPDKNQSLLCNDLSDAVDIQNISKPLEALLIMAILVKIIYMFGYFTPFKFLVVCLKNGVTNISMLIIILLIYLTGLAVYLRENMGSNSSSFQDIFYIINLILEMFSGIKPLMKSVFVDDPYYPLNIIAIYIPFMIICFFIVSNVFIGVMNKTYRDFNETNEVEIDGTLTFKQFMTMVLDQFRRKHYKLDVNLELTDDIIFQQKDDMTTNVIFDLYELRNNLKEMNTWGAICAQTIMKEYEVRKSFKNLVKIISSAKDNEDYLRSKGAKITENIFKKTREFKMRLKYWQYFRNTEFMMMNIMNHYNELNEAMQFDLEDNFETRRKKEADKKIKRYIVFLEKKLEDNMNHVRLLQNKVSVLTEENLYKSEESNL